jgi:hypothetical protein
MHVPLQRQGQRQGELQGELQRQRQCELQGELQRQRQGELQEKKSEMSEMGEKGGWSNHVGYTEIDKEGIVFSGGILSITAPPVSGFYTGVKTFTENTVITDVSLNIYPYSFVRILLMNDYYLSLDCNNLGDNIYTTFNTPVTILENSKYILLEIETFDGTTVVSASIPS